MVFLLTPVIRSVQTVVTRAAAVAGVSLLLRPQLQQLLLLGKAAGHKCQSLACGWPARVHLLPLQQQPLVLQVPRQQLRRTTPTGLRSRLPSVVEGLLQAQAAVAPAAAVHHQG